MKKCNWKKGLLILGLSGPMVANFSCSSAFLEQFRDAAISGATSFVEQVTYDLLDSWFLPGETAEGS
jgi:hypothetical protein